jgi:hypothetical protein
MRTNRPPLAAAWMLDRFGSAPETEVIAGDLSEQYQQGRSRFWYWREVIVAVLRGAWSGVHQHSLLSLVAIATAWTVGFVWQWVLTPIEYSLIVRYVLGGHAPLEGIPLVGFMIEAPLAVAMGWTVARVARPCRIPAVFGLVASTLFVSVWSIWRNAQIVPESLGFHLVSVLPLLWPIPLMTVLVLLGGGLLTGLPKRSIRTQ